MSVERNKVAGPVVVELTRAFEAFTAATDTLEGAYRTLQERVAAMTGELEEKNRLLQQSLERQRSLEAEALRHSRLAAMGEMAATLAHEVRNPLGSMELFSSLLLDDLADRPAARRLVSQIAEGIKDLNHLVTNILGFTRAPVPRPRRVDVVAAIEDALRYGAPLLAESRVAIVRHYESSRIVAQADPSFVRQVFLNLIRNAAQAMEGGGGTLTIRAEVAERVAVSFADTGPGIPSEARQRIFEPFFTTKERGTGLGLAVVRTLVETLGGEVTERNRTGEGACFTVILPAAEDAAHAVRGGGARAEPGAQRRDEIGAPPRRDAASAGQRQHHPRIATPT
jgi:two-component system sensor histidine kinase FlrB